jgi:hypothetical protein
MHYVITYLVYIVTGRSTSMVVHPSHESTLPEASETYQFTGAPEWQLLDRDDYYFPDCAGRGGAAVPGAGLSGANPNFTCRRKCRKNLQYKKSVPIILSRNSTAFWQTL